MKPFLYQVATLFYQLHGAEISRLAFVFPNRRAGLFFQKYLAELSDKPLFSPTVLTINDLLTQLSGKQPADPVRMLFLLYEIYTRLSHSEEGFDEFLYWGEMLLNDFNDVDKYLADARMLFSNVSDLRTIEEDFSFLSEEQIAAIRTFWSSFYPKGDTPNQQQFLAVWQTLYALYSEFRERLATEGKGYDGMIFREVVEQLQQGGTCELPYRQVIFVGLNALSTSEECFLSELQKRGIADFYWDYTSSEVRDPNNKASYFAFRNLAHFPSLHQLPEEVLPERQIEAIGIPSGIGQAKEAGRLLETLCREDEMTPDRALRTAVVLPDEQLLLPVLNAIPEQIRRINVTMGYPLAGTPVATLMEYILALQKQVRFIDRQPAFYFRDVLPVLNHRYVAEADPETTTRLVREITENNRIYIPFQELDRTPLLHILFTPVADAAGLSDYLIRVLGELNNRLTPPEEEEVVGKEDTRLANARDIEQEFIFHYFTTVNRMKEVMRETGVEMRTDTYFRLLKRMTDTITIPFHGEPLSGLQIMGVLETRALDFDRLIILSMNEGTFPLKRATNSFIPYNLRRGFGLPTYEHQDSIWAYHFYRLIQRAAHVSLLYDTRSNGLQTGEASRFIHQLRYHYEVPVARKLVVYDVSSSRTPALEVPKGIDVQLRLSTFLKGGARALSASAINTYLDCPLKFYFSVVEEVREEEEVSENIESDLFGSILHKVMEILYQPFQGGKMVTADLLSKLRKDSVGIGGAIARAFASEFFKTEVVRPLSGQNYLIGEMIRKYVEKVLERDAKLTPFNYIESEKAIKALCSTTGGKAVQLKGFIDRIDEVNGTLRIIDYKSGGGSTLFNSVEELFDLSAKERPKAVMQVFLYAWMYLQRPENREKEIMPGIYYMRTLFSPTFDASLFRRIERTKTARVEHFSEYHVDFEMGLRSCLDRIFSPDVPFTQTTNERVCGYCQFRTICGK